MGDSGMLNNWSRGAKLGPGSRNSIFHSYQGIRVLVNDLRLNEAGKLINRNSSNNEIISKSQIGKILKLVDKPNQVACVTSLMILTVMYSWVTFLLQLGYLKEKHLMCVCVLH